MKLLRLSLMLLSGLSLGLLFAPAGHAAQNPFQSGTPAKIRTAADLPNPILIMNMDGSTAHEVHLGWLPRWSPDSNYVVHTTFTGSTRMETASCG